MEMEILQQIKKCADAVNTNVIEHTAYIRATAEKKDMDLDKYKIEVRKELASTSAKTPGISLTHIFIENCYLPRDVFIFEELIFRWFTKNVIYVH